MSSFTTSDRLRTGSSLEAARRALLEAARELSFADDEAGRLAAQALREAEAELARARSRLNP